MKKPRSVRSKEPVCAGWREPLNCNHVVRRRKSSFIKFGIPNGLYPLQITLDVNVSLPSWYQFLSLTNSDYHAKPWPLLQRVAGWPVGVRGAWVSISEDSCDNDCAMD